MRSYHFPSVKTEHQTVISRFGGADFRSHPTKVTLTRSPDLQNLVCDRNDFLVKRTGWKTVERYDAPVYGVFPAPDGEGAFGPRGRQSVLPSRKRRAVASLQQHERRVFTGVYDERRAVSA